MSAFLSAGESLTPSPVTVTMAPCLWHPSTMISFCCGDVRAKTISEWLARMSSICAGVMYRRSLPCTTHAFASLKAHPHRSCWGIELNWTSLLSTVRIRASNLTGPSLLTMAWTLAIARRLHESNSWPAALYNLGRGRWLAWANGATVHYVAIHCPR